jgi:DNA invertase Pin-like site-specific DNA recombinase
MDDREEKSPGPVAPAPSVSGRGGRRDDAAERRRSEREEVAAEVEALAAEFHARLPRERAVGVGVIYARYSTRFQASIADQVRSCFEAAVARGLFVPVDHVCFDLAVRGAKESRAGLGRAHALVQGGGVAAFLAFTTNRLHRKMHRCMRFVEEELVERGVRAIFPKSGIDTADEQRWKMQLGFNAVMDELSVGMYAENVRAAHEGLMVRGMVTGSLCFGYAGEPVPGELTRLKRPRCRVAVDPKAGPMVETIYRWFAEGHLTIDEIVRRLNADASVPLPPCSQTGAWTRVAVRAMLSNPRYRGTWEYGATQAVWQSKKDYSRKVRRDQALRTVQSEGLRLVLNQV